MASIMPFHQLNPRLVKLVKLAIKSVFGGRNIVHPVDLSSLYRNNVMSTMITVDYFFAHWHMGNHGLDPSPKDKSNPMSR